jgi:hypothetical protein
MGPKSGYRARLFRALHVEGVKRGLDHQALHAMFASSFGLRTMADATDAQLLGVYRQWTGKTLKYRGQLPRRNESPDAEMVSRADIEDLDQEFAKRGLAGNGRAEFIRRQLRGRDLIRTRKDYTRVMGGLRAMNRRDNYGRPNGERDSDDGGGGERGGGAGALVLPGRRGGDGNPPGCEGAGAARVAGGLPGPHAAA